MNKFWPYLPKQMLIYVKEEAKAYAIKQGLYVISPNGEGVEISNPDHFSPRAWVVEAN